MNGNRQVPCYGSMVYVCPETFSLLLLLIVSDIISGLRKDCLLVWTTTASSRLGVFMLLASSTIIQDVWSMCQAGLANLAFFYFDHRDTAQLDARTLLSSLLVQLYNQSDYFREVLTTVYMAHDCGSRQPGEEELLQCLRDMVSQGKSPVYIIIDALDECPDSSGLASPRAEVLEIIRRLSDISSRVYLCIASRLETDIRRVIKPLTSHIVSLDKNDGHHKDIAEYVKFIVHSDPTIGEWPEGEKRLIIDTLTHNCGGMYVVVFMRFRSTF